MSKQEVSFSGGAAAKRSGVRSDRETCLAVIRDVREAYGPDYLGLCGHGPKPDVDRIIKKYGISRNEFWHIVTAYFQGGMLEEICPAEPGLKGCD